MLTKCKFMSYLKVSILVLGLLFSLTQVFPVSAATPEKIGQAVDDATLWLTENLVDNQSWGYDLAATIRTATEITKYFAENQLAPETVDRTKAWLQEKETTNNDFAARLLYFYNDPEKHNDILNSLFVSQQVDGGWGLTKEYESNILDSVIVLRALLNETEIEENVITRGISFLLKNQNPDGSWSFVRGQPGNIYLTAETILLLNEFTVNTLI